MGGVVDSSVWIAAERAGQSARDILSALAKCYPQEPPLLSVVVLAELVQGIYQAKTEEQRLRRTSFVRAVARATPILPVTSRVAWTAGRIRGEQALLGNTLPSADSLIAATALVNGCAVITLNLMDFERIPELRVLPFTLR